ncbi:LLM class flavin-dependent oxidoreductase, partial [Methylobacterium sp. WL116]|uniref:alpha/beta fold hydrolase n=1 Tax=Methylobacterium sp. WL116 TaxID=2603889 RepID=UPI0011CB5804
MRETATLDLTVAGRLVPTPCDRIGAGPDVLLLPALSTIASRAEMRGLADQLAWDHRCLIPDWPGFGAHPRARLPLNPATFHAYLDALLAVTTRLKVIAALLPGPWNPTIAAKQIATISELTDNRIA